MQSSELQNAVTRQTWDWLIDLPDRLDVAIEIIDERRVSLLSAGRHSTVRDRLASSDSLLDAAIGETIAGEGATTVTWPDGSEATCFALTVPAASAPVGVLVVAGCIAQSGSSDEARRDLQSIGAWFKGAVQDALATPPNGVTMEAYRITAVRRMLTDTPSRGSIRRVLGAYVEALGVWEEVLVSAYAADAVDGYFQYVSQVGGAAFPARLGDDYRGSDGRAERLSRAEIARLHLNTSRDVIAIPLSDDGADMFLLLVAGAIDELKLVRLRLFASMLKESVSEILAAAVARVAGEERAPESIARDQLQADLEAVLSRLTDELGAERGVLSVDSAEGSRDLMVGDADLLAGLDDRDRADWLVVTVPGAEHDVTAVLARRAPPFAAFERDVVRGAAVAVQPRVHACFERALPHERRRRSRAVDSLFDQLAAEAVDAGQQASVIVVAISAGEREPGLAEAWLGRIRSHLRANDCAGLVNDREIAVLLCDASPDHAALVSARLKDILATDAATGRVLHPTFGVTTRSPAKPFSGSLVGSARAGLGRTH